MIYFWFVKDLITISLQFLYDLKTICLWFAWSRKAITSDLLMISKQFLDNLFMICLWIVSNLFVICYCDLLAHLHVKFYHFQITKKSYDLFIICYHDLFLNFFCLGRQKWSLNKLVFEYSFPNLNKRHHLCSFEQ